MRLAIMIKTSAKHKKIIKASFWEVQAVSKIKNSRYTIPRLLGAIEVRTSAMLAVAQELSAADSSDPLLNAGVLQNVLSYVGPGHCLSVAPVSKWWKEIYCTVQSQELTVEDDYDSYTISCGPNMTLFSSVFASASCVHLAWTWLQIKSLSACCRQIR
jgi:hypothetical protein